MDKEETERLAHTIDESLVAKDEGYVTLAPGDRLADRYVVEKLLGEGGMGLVYKAVDTQLNQPVAIKLLKKGLSQNDQAVERLKQEAQVAMMLTHPSVMRLINFEQNGDYAFLLMEYVEGRPMDEMIKGGRKLGDKVVAQLAFRISEALDYAHEKGVIHRDIKPANIMVSPDGKQVKLMDFGIARTLTTGDAARPTIAGTIAYIAPEVFAGEHPDTRVDLYALGMTMYELLAGVHPFRGAPVKEIIRRHMEEEPPPLEGIDRGLAHIVFQLVEKKPNARFRSARELMSALARYLDIDEEARVKRMKKMVEYEQARLKAELKRIEREKEDLASRIEEANRQENASSTTTPAFGATPAVAAPAISSDDLRPFLFGLGTGIVGVFAGAALTGSNMFEFSTPASAEASAAILTVAVTTGGPAYLLFNQRLGFIGAGVGALVGWIAYGIGRGFFNFFYEQEMWRAMELSADLALAAPVGLLATLIATAGHDWTSPKERIGAGVLSAIAMAALVAGGGLNVLFGEENNILRYPLVALVASAAWGFACITPTLIDLVKRK